jgi:hypothetical protein
MPKQTRKSCTLHSLIDECIINPQTPEEESIESARIARECEKIHEERRAANAYGRRVRREIAFEPNMGRMDYCPPVYAVPFSGQSSTYLGSH